MTRRGTAAVFDRTSQHRRSMIAKVHIAKQQLALNDDDYRAIILRETGHLSAADCDDRQLETLLAAFARQGFAAKKPARAADHPSARKARALWISLHQLGAIENPVEAALEAFARRQLRCERMQWVDQSLTYKLIEALKAMASRAGWDQDLAGVAPAATVLVLKRRLVQRQLDILVERAFVPVAWRVERAAREFGGIEIDSVLFATASELDLVAAALGRVINGDARDGAGA